MHEFHYKYVKEKYISKAKVLFSYTRSLTYDIETNNVYVHFCANKDISDSSEYSENSKFYDKMNKKVIGN